MNENYAYAPNKTIPADFPDEMSNLTSLKFFHVGIESMGKNKEQFQERIQTLLPNCEVKIW